jgi:hypothetical protein
MKNLSCISVPLAVALSFALAPDARAQVPAGGEFRVNTYTTSAQRRPAIGKRVGGFVVTWHSDGPDGSLYGIRGQRYASDGSAQGAEFAVNTYTTEYQYWPRMSMNARGSFVVTWNSYGQDGSEWGAFGKRFDANGVAQGAEFQANTYTTGYQGVSSIQMDDVGNYVVAWHSDQDPTGGGRGVYAQRFGGLFPNSLIVDTTGNTVWEPGESVDMRPAWRNQAGSPQTFGATLTNLTGPAGATYTLVDGTGNYGTVADNSSAVCTDCYMVQVNNPSPRPIQHWDASALESITPDTQGQQKSWRLHIGLSFDDVPTTNPFYRFIETLLHFGITGGCGGQSYCPGNPTTRDQMSVFVLVAKEGAGYAPPACSPPNVFTDVDENNPFCRFIEELFNRGVVGGCGPGPTYCPTSPVTREQMAVFVLRTLDPTLNPPACVPPNLFADVPETSAFCRWIEELANRGVVGGCGGGNYCPTGTVTRDQMGVFISLTFGLNLYGP